MPQSRMGGDGMKCSRRLFIEGIGAFTAVTVTGCKAPKRDELPLMRFGLVTDCHYADIPYARRMKHSRITPILNLPNY